ncbi:major facilitator family multidrug-efflux transporter [Listeria aquatica FSL S10-1188]|uniref:Major facilitator family multidrug-efflux transporter n=1 Tax=Listeria aquatica FSL S10-1188 TaxID=1265818 RepID=W7ARM7_9LIST|nr:major facilitator family multidrug-efflux transporter [Listeria aquatica FSL S10-1188]
MEARFNSKHVLKFTLASCAVILVLLGVIPILWIRIVLIILSGLILGINNALFTTTVMEHSPYTRSVTSGAYNFVRWLGAAFAPIVSGLISEMFGTSYPFIVAAILAVVGMALLFLKIIPEHQTKTVEATE